MDKINFNC